MSLRLLFLGTGTSAGVPMIACECPVCRSEDPRDRRSRPSVLIAYPDAPRYDVPRPSPTGWQDPGTPLSPVDTAHPPVVDASVRRLLVDTTPELRLQMVRHRVGRIDGVLYTHAHADHVFGIDDLRRFNAVQKSAIDVFAESEAISYLRGAFPYIFEPDANVNRSFVPSLLPHPVRPGVPLDLFGARWTPLRLLHGLLPILGFRVDRPGPRGTSSLAYCTDVSRIPDETFPLLERLHVLVIDALRYEPHPTHLTVEQALEAIARIRPRVAYLTHLAHDISHADLSGRLPPGVHVAYDGLEVVVEP